MIWPLLPKCAAIGLALSLLSATGGYLHGRAMATLRAEALAARQLRAQIAATQELQLALDAATQRAASAERARAAQAKDIRDEIDKLTARPAYRHGCIDADGVRLLEQAVRNANAAH